MPRYGAAGPTAIWREADVRDAAALQAAIDDCAQAMDGIDAVVANAGVAAYGTVRQPAEASFERRRGCRRVSGGTARGGRARVTD